MSLRSSGSTTRITASSNPSVRGEANLIPGRVATETIGDRSYRAVAARLVPETGIGLAAVTPSSGIAAEKRSVIGRLLFGLVGSLLLIAFVAYLDGRSIVAASARSSAAANCDRAGRLASASRSGRDEFALLGAAFNEMADQLRRGWRSSRTSARRLRDANVRFGEALAATHDVDQLLRVIVEAAVEATRRRGRRLVTARTARSSRPATPAGLGRSSSSR